MEPQPQGADLRDELWKATNEANTAFEGNFYHASTLANALNPCMSISGLGLVGLPLTNRDAGAIIANCSAPALSGKGKRNVAPQAVRDTWEIDSRLVSFGNTGWKNYVDNTLSREVCKSLGVKIGAHPPKMELQKLLLFDSGSTTACFTPGQDTQRVIGAFASATILLPSFHSGGEVVFSHMTITKSVDLSRDSLQSTTLVAWYTDVKHAIKPLTSGYRLALSYSLIHDQSSGLPYPILPSMSPMMLLCQVI
uniref:Prolyl 4-hydroxylase alpha subunit Fe(2+) 2OG dioxygenase domain-containing protein n=1 Tax=Psilocybe cubensis TaxID=181762 RepID=A0A8H8CPT0_PSICU